jgi:hypothetical protein
MRLTKTMVYIRLARSSTSSWKGNKAAQEANWCSAKSRFTLDDRQQKSWSLVFRNLWLPLNLNSLVPHQYYLTHRILVLKRHDTINAALTHLSSFNMFAGSSPIPFDDSMNPRFLL